MSNSILYIVIFVVLLLILFFVYSQTSLFGKNKNDNKAQLKSIEDLMIKFEATLERSEKLIKDEFQRNRRETNDNSANNREELTKALNIFGEKFSQNVNELNELLRQKFGDFSKQQSEINKQTTDNVKEVKEAVEKELKKIREDNTAQLEEVRKTVDEKLQKTLNERLSQSFEIVGKQLQTVQEGLGEMRNLAADVGGLKKVLTNVKMRGGIGEIQLEMLLEQILAPDQYAANVNTNANNPELVEFAIKLPGKGDLNSTVWLPIDAKFPKDIYEQLIEAYEDGDKDKVNFAKKMMESTIKKMAKDIRDKYLDPPHTTDFGIMFLPFESIYAEIIRNSSLLESLQRDYKITVAGPTTLAALLNSLQIGFKTLAIEKRSSEVWQVLGAVKKEFENFEGMMNKAQKNIRVGLDQLDDVMGTRTRAIQRRLKSVETLSEAETNKIIPELTDPKFIIDNDETE